ncbi:MAG: SOS response-associated peptidase [Acidimicrobiales bacterium]|jgi:putative SOS response-associated peptidase YedK
MCGRFVASRPVEEIARLLEVDEVDVPPELNVPRWNIAPQQTVLAVTEPAKQPGVRRLSTFRWGLVPRWAKDPSIGVRAFNAKAETAQEKPMFRNAFDHRRCVIPADAFYEWAPPDRHDSSRRRLPWCFKSPDSGLLLLAGLFEHWRPLTDEAAAALSTCTILTTGANGLVSAIHDRMPVLIAEEDLDVWLAPGPLGTAEAGRLLRPAHENALERFRVSTKVNDARTDGPELEAPLEVDSLDGAKGPSDPRLS